MGNIVSYPMKLIHLLFAALTMAGSCGAVAQGYPTKPIRLVVPFAAGGPTDVLARSLAKELSIELGQPVVVDNRAGAGGSIGIVMVAKAAPDGYTIGIAHTGSISISPHIYKANAYDPRRDLSAITPLVSYTNVLVVNPQLPVHNLREFIAWTKQHKGATIASGGNGATNHLSAELLKSLTGADLTHVAYRGNAPALIDVMNGNVSAMFDIPITALPQIRAGRVIALTVTSSERSSYLPEVPTMDEAGVSGFKAAGSELWFGLVGPANLPDSTLARLHSATISAMQTPQLKDAVRRMAYEPWTQTPAEFSAFIRSDYEKWARLVKLAGLKAE